VLGIRKYWMMKFHQMRVWFWLSTIAQVAAAGKKEHHSCAPAEGV